MSLDIGFASQTPRLPSGGGVTGLGETFTPDLSTGSGTYEVPLDIPPGPNDIGPKLTLRYSSSSGSGPFGVGWSLPLPRLLRSTATGRPALDSADSIVLEGSGPLVRAADGSLRPEVDTGDWRVEAAAAGFLVTDRAGKRYRLGVDDDSRVTAPNGLACAWLLAHTEDNLGHTVRFTWRRAGPQRYLRRVTYGAYRIEFLYEKRPDTLRDSRSGFMLVTHERCSAIELHLEAAVSSLVRRWQLKYTRGEPAGVSLLTRVTLTGFGPDGAQLEAPSLKLQYQKPAPVRLRRLPVNAAGLALPDLADSRVELVDWDGDGYPDVLEVGAGGSARVWTNAGGQFAAPRLVGSMPQLAAAESAVGLMDVNGDGIADVVRLDRPLAEYQPRTSAGLARPVRWRHAPSVPLGSSSARIADFDGDGLVELLWSTGRSLLLARRDEGRGWDPHPLVAAIAGGEGAPPVDLSDPHIFCADMTGDGTTDLVRVDGGGVTYWPFLGQRFGDAVRMASPPRLPAQVDPRRLFVVDLDGDGCADVLLVDDGRVRWWPNRSGAAFAVARDVEHVPTSAMRDLRVADMLGTGSPQLCWSVTLPSGRASWFCLDLTGSVRPSLLTSINNSMGAVTTITYSTSAAEAARDRAAGEPWRHRQPVVLPVVHEIVVTDKAAGEVETTRFRYHEGRFDGALRELCGFGRVEQENVGDAHVATQITTRWFSTGLEPDGSEPPSVPRRRVRRALRGRLLRQERAGETAAVLDATTYDWEVVEDDVALVPRMVRSTTWSYEGGSEPANWLTTEWSAWDASGNVTEMAEYAYEAGSSDPIRTLRTRISYAHDSTGRYRQRVSRVQQDDGDGTLIADTITEYDHLPYGAPASVGAEGLITARWGLALPDGLVGDVYGAAAPDLAALGYHRRSWGAGWWVAISRYERNDGNDAVRGVITGPRGAKSVVTLDRTQCHPERLADEVGHAILTTYDPRSCQPTSLTDVSGATSRVRLDPLARVVALIMPDDEEDEPTTTYEYRTSVIPTEVVIRRRAGANSEPATERHLFDGAGRLLERRIQTETGEVCTETTDYGGRGLAVRRFKDRPAASTRWRRPPATAPHITIDYDALDRPVRTVRADGGVATLRYLPGVVEDADEADNEPASPHHGTVTRRHLDPTARVTRVEQRLGDTVLTDTYTHDTKGRLVQHVDAAGHVSRFTFDLLGRAVHVERPEATYVAVLDAAGNSVEARNGTDRVTRRFDAANRLVSVHHGAASSPPVETYTYHDASSPPPADAGSHTRGRLLRVDHEAGSIVWDYDARGRVSRRMTRLTGGPSVDIAVGYRPDDLLESVTYPVTGTGAPFVARYRYDRRGHLVAIDGIVQQIERDVEGRPTLTRYANGVDQHDSYDPRTGWHLSSRIEHGGTVLRSVALTHDAVGNVLAQSSPDPSLSWTYQYDELYRLVQAAAAGSAGPRTYAYDAVGNLVSSSDLGAFTYGAGAAPNCLTSAGTDTFSYDSRGHVSQAPWGAHTVDPQGRLRRIDHTDGAVTAFTYDHEGRLIRRQRTTAGGDVSDAWSVDRLVWVKDGEVVFQILEGDRVVARRHAAGSCQWVHLDHLGSVVLVTDDSGTVTRSVRYSPYGEVLASSGSDSLPQGYGSGELDASGLVLLGARWYCPRIGRFLSPDPIVADAFDPFAWNSYAYARCNPTSFVDPTGRSAGKVFLGIIATLLIVAVVVCVSVLTFGTFSPGAIAVGTKALGLTWGAVFAATVVGVAAGGAIGGLAAYKANGDVLLGILVGGAVGGFTAFTGTLGGGALAYSVGGPLVGKIWGGLIAKGAYGALTGFVQGGGFGFATAFGGGVNNGIGQVWESVWQYAAMGTLSGALGKLASSVVTKVVKPPEFMTSKAGPVTTAEISWTIGYKLAGKSLDKFVLTVEKGKASSQGEVALDLGMAGALKAAFGGTVMPPGIPAVGAI